MIKALDVHTRTKLRSTQFLTSLPHIISELVQNSLDANATWVEIGVDCDEWMCWVKDNGSGISKDGLSSLAHGPEKGRYMTSKSFRNDPIAVFGFRGEALSSVANLSCLEISSRTAHSRETWSVILKGSKTLYMGPAVRWRQQSSGTVVCVRDAFYSLPVRRRSHPTSSRSLELIRRTIESYFLVFPHVTFSLENLHRQSSNSSENRIIRIPRASSTLIAFRSIYGKALAEYVEEVDMSEGELKLSGFISLVGGHSKEYQFLYVNRQPLARCRLHGIIDKAFASSTFATNALDESGEKNLPHLTNRRSPRKAEKRHVYVLNLTIPQEDVDNCLEPTKTEVQFQDKNAVERLISSCIKSFLSRNGFESSRILCPLSKNKSSQSKRKKNDDPEHSDSDSTVPIFEKNALERSYSITGISSPATEKLRSIIGVPNRRTLPLQALNKRGTDISYTTDNTPIWLQQALKANPVYESTEKGVPSLKLVSNRILHKTSLGSDDFSTQNSYAHPHHCHANDQDEQNSVSYRFQKEDLRRARVINQVDKKFIACLIEISQNGDIDGRSAFPQSDFRGADLSPTLVFIDQHAADERVRVERFLRELCLGFIHEHDDTVGTLQGGIVVRKIFPPVHILLTICEARRISKSPDIRQVFRRWGFVFGVPHKDLALDADSAGYCQIAVIGVPELVADKLLLGHELRDIVKGFLGQLETDMPPTTLSRLDVIEETDDSYWLKALRWCPRGLLDLVNSKACRGAIMFNDTLSIDQCEKLLQNLSKTAFPFQCAHGRPSLIPLANIGANLSRGRKQGRRLG